MRRLALAAPLAIAAVAAALFLTPRVSSDEVAPAAHVVIVPADVKWADGPPSLPPGAKLAVIRGDMNKANVVTFRLKVPAGYRVPPHWHPADEHVTVLEGSLHMGMGETFDEAAGHEMPPGGFAAMTAGVRHFAWSKNGATIQVHAMGPWGINYVNPADDPRTKK